MITEVLPKTVRVAIPVLPPKRPASGTERTSQFIWTLKPTCFRTGRWAGQFAGKNFDDFGTTTNAKLSTRVQASEAFALRASLGTGFRAPTPGQQKRIENQHNF